MTSYPKLPEELGEDRISQMPDDVLIRILSLLDDTVLAVQTTILSKRWNNLWTSISSLRLESHYRRIHRGRTRRNISDDHFMTLVDRVLSLHDSTDIRKFRLSYQNEGLRDEMLADDYTRICRYICTVVEHNVVELDLCLINFGKKIPFWFPESLFMCKTLVVLKVDSNIFSFSNCPTAEYFPSLKVLCVEFFEHDDDSFPKHFTCCPVLEVLTICCLTPGHQTFLNINISAPELKTLRIKLEFNLCFPVPAYNFFINAPKLEKLDVNDDLFVSNYLFENGKSIINAKIRLHTVRESDESPLGGVVEYLSLAVKGLDSNECNVFNPPELPACLVSHLQTISMKRFDGQQDEMELAQYLLKNCEVLNTMSIDTTRDWMSIHTPILYTKEELFKKFLTYECGSESCLIKILD